MFDVIIGYFILLLYLNRITDSFIIKLVPLVLLIILSVKYYNRNVNFRKKNACSTPKVSKLLLVLCILLTIGLLRTNNPDTNFLSKLNLVFVFIGFIVLTKQMYVYISARYDNNFRVYHSVIVTPFFLFALFNLFFWIMGVQVKDSVVDIGNSVILSQLGLNLPRVTFPFANGINSYATVMGGLFSLQLCYVFLLGQKKIFNYFQLFIFLITLLLTDSRSAILYPVLILVLLKIIYTKKSIGWVKILPLWILVGPIVLMTILPLLASSSFFENFSRSSEDFVTGNGRFVIWGLAIKNLLMFKVENLIGYGIFGHVPSGASQEWASFFGYMDNAEIVHPHNTVLSIIFDLGYIGFLVFIFFHFISVNRIVKLWQHSSKNVIFYLSFYFYFIIICTTESFFGFYYLNSIYLILFVFGIPFNISLSVDKGVKEVRLENSVV